METTTAPTWSARPRAPHVEWNRPCPNCGGQLQRVVVGNIVDYRHAGTCAAGAR